MKVLSTKPYLLRAIYEWCVDQGLTPYLAAVVDDNTRVPPGSAQEGRIVLNVGPDATHELQMGNDEITFQARFGGVAHSLWIPVDNVLAIYARENGQGMAFEAAVGGDLADGAPEEVPESAASGEIEGDANGSGGEPDQPRSGARTGHLRIIK